MHRDIEQFELQEPHITLLQNAYVSWEDCEYGAPSIDCKRPYGNSNVLEDMRALLGGYTDDELAELHKETQTALQVILDTKSFQWGLYEREKYGGKWALAAR